MSKDNGTIAREGLERGVGMIFSRLTQIMSEYSSKEVMEADDQREFFGFTGNTQTSYTAIVYRDGAVTHTASTSQRYPQPPVHAKIELGKSLFLAEPYEGEPRRRGGKANIMHPFAEQTIAAIRKAPANEKGVTTRFALGVEYHNFLPGTDPLEIMRFGIINKMSSLDSAKVNI